MRKCRVTLTIAERKSRLARSSRARPRLRRRIRWGGGRVTWTTPSWRAWTRPSSRSGRVGSPSGSRFITRPSIPTFVLAHRRACAAIPQTEKCPRGILSSKQHAPQPGAWPSTMPLAEPEPPDVPKLPVGPLTGASGFVGERLIPLLEHQPVALRGRARTPDPLRPLIGPSTPDPGARPAEGAAVMTDTYGAGRHLIEG